MYIYAFWVYVHAFMYIYMYTHVFCIYLCMIIYVCLSIYIHTLKYTCESYVYFCIVMYVDVYLYMGNICKTIYLLVVCIYIYTFADISHHTLMQVVLQVQDVL